MDSILPSPDVIGIFVCELCVSVYYRCCNLLLWLFYLKCSEIIKNLSLTEIYYKDMINRVRPRLVTFDVTGTLLMTKVEEHYSEIGSQYGLFVEPKKLARSFKSNFTQLSKEHPIYGKHTGLGWENWWRIIVHNVFRDQHASVSKNQLDKVLYT